MGLCVGGGTMGLCGEVTWVNTFEKLDQLSSIAWLWAEVRM